MIDIIIYLIDLIIYPHDRHNNTSVIIYLINAIIYLDVIIYLIDVIIYLSNVIIIYDMFIYYIEDYGNIMIFCLSIFIVDSRPLGRESEITQTKFGLL